MTKPFIKWVGGKSSAITAISEFYPDNIASIKNYCEPFIGGGAMFFHLASLYKFEKIIINGSSNNSPSSSTNSSSSSSSHSNEIQRILNLVI